MNMTNLVGLIAEVLLIVSQLPQIIKSFKTKSTEDLSLLTIVCVLLGLVFWVVYGLLRPDPIIVIANIMSIGMFSLVLYAKIKFS